VAVLSSSILPYLEIFDLNRLALHNPIAVPQITDPRATQLSVIWGYVALAVGYAAAYAWFALSAGMWLFHNRELGGAEG